MYRYIYSVGGGGGGVLFSLLLLLGMTYAQGMMMTTCVYASQCTVVMEYVQVFTITRGHSNESPRHCYYMRVLLIYLTAMFIDCSPSRDTSCSRE